MNFVDLLLVLLALATIATGLFQGTIRIVIALITLYASIVLASLYFRFLAVFFTRRGTSLPIAEAISFFVILVICFAILFFATVYTFRYLRFPPRLNVIDRMLGTLLGIVLAAMVGVSLSMVLHHAFVRHTVAATGSVPMVGMFQRSVRSSRIMNLLLDRARPRLYASMAPFVPEAAQPFFVAGR